MKVGRVFATLIGIGLMLQACGNKVGISAPSAVIPVSGGNAFFSPISFRSGIGYRGPWLELYFTDPSSPLAQHQVGGVEEFVSDSILKATKSIDVALRTLSLDGITKALVLAHERGVKVRIVTDTDSLVSRYKFKDLHNAGIPVVDDRQERVMDNKYIVIDGNQVWTGSMNFTPAGVFREDAAIIHIFSADIATDYMREFDEMFVRRQFGPLTVPDTPYPEVTIQGTQVEVLFSPDDIVGARLIQLLREAHESICFLAYAFGSEDFGGIIRKRAADGIKVSGVLDFDQVNPEREPAPNPNQLAEFNLFRFAGLDIRRDGGPETMNHKFIVIDKKIVVMGSYDFTSRAELENDENVLIIHNADIAQKFLDEFQRVYAQAQP